MSELNNVLLEILLGQAKDEVNVNEDYNVQQILERLREFIDIEDLFMNQQQDNRLHDFDDDQEMSQGQTSEDESQSIQQQQQEFLINEPFLQSEQTKQQIHEQMQKNPHKRTFFKAIGTREPSYVQNQYGTRSHREGPKQYNVYKFSDFRYAPTLRVKKIYNYMINNTLYRFRKITRQKFDKEYFDGLISSFRLLNDRQIQDYKNQNKQLEEVRRSLREKKTQKELENALSLVAKYQNESKDDYFIIQQDKKQTNLYEKLLTSDKTYHNHYLETQEFYDDLLKIATRKRIKLDDIPLSKPKENETPKENGFRHTTNTNENLSQNGFQIDQEDDENRENNDIFDDNKFVSNFFGAELHQRQLWGQLQYDETFESKKKINEIDLFIPNFRYKYIKQEPGVELNEKIIKQIDAERRLNEQLRDSRHDPDELKKIREEQEKNKEKIIQKSDEEKTLENLLDRYSYYNEHIVDFCLGKNDNFLTKPYSHFNRVEIDLNNNQFFAEKLEVLQHLKHTQVITSQVHSTDRRDQVSMISRPQEQTSIRSFERPHIKNSEIASKNPNDRISMDMNSDATSERGEDEFDMEEQEMQQSLQLPLSKDEQSLQDIRFIIESHQKRRITPAPIHNSIVAEQFLLNNFSQEIDRHDKYHRSDIMEILIIEKERQQMGYNILKKQIPAFDPWNIYVGPSQSLNEINDSQEQNLLLEEYPEKLNSQDCYKSLKKLSLVKDDFILFEYLEQRPLIMNDTGMCIKAHRYLYDYRTLNAYRQYQIQYRIEQHGIQLFKQMIVEKFGKFGQIQFKTKNEFLPTQGQLTDESITGLTIIENDLYRAPVFKQKLPETDFLLVRRQDEKGNYQYVLRAIDYIFIVGQIEPKEEIYTPHSRSLGTFLKNCLKTYIKQRFRATGKVSEDDLQEIFPKQSKQNRRNALKECNGTQDPNNPNIWNFTTIQSQGDPNQILKYDITAKQVCRYESMLYSCYLLHKFGLRELKNSDKMKKTLQVFLQRHPNEYRDWVIARRIEDELNMTSWSLSTSFQHSANKTGRMMLYGFGDPSGGMGGLSYVKKPLKARGEKDIKNKGIQDKKPVVMGTDADLRKLHVHDTREILLKLGKTPEQVAPMKRWQMIQQIAKITQSAQEDQDSEASALYRQRLKTLDDKQMHYLKVIIKFAKNQRLTTKMQKDQYQKELNTMLNLLVSNLSIQFQGETIHDFKQFKQFKKTKKIQDEKLKELEYEPHEIEPYVVDDFENYMLKLDAFIKKEKKIWEEKKRKKGLPL